MGFYFHLKGRFQIELERSVREAGDDESRQRFQEALDRLGLLFAGTIHSFCARILRERPIEARLDPDFQELEEDENTLLRDRCWSEYLEGLQITGAPILDTLRDLGINPGDLGGVYRNVAQYPEVEVVREELNKPEFRKEKGLLKSFLRDASQALPREVPAKGWDGLQKVLRLALLRSRHLGMDRDAEFIKILSGLDRAGAVTQNRWPSRDQALDQKEKFDTFRKGVVAPALDYWRRYCHSFIMELVVPGLSHFKSFREEKSLMNFQDLLLKTAILLQNNPEVRAYFQNRFTHILVDEFQDTDPIQAEVILYLTGEDLTETCWRNTRVKPGSLFIVGDPKQSIYRFRRADIDTYNEVKRMIEDSGGAIVPLTTNFRSLPGICNWVNAIFEKRFPARATQYQAGYERLVPHMEIAGGEVCRITLPAVERHKQQLVAQLDAEKIASWISRALDGNVEILSPEDEGKEKRPAQPGDFMILLRYKDHLSFYAQAIEALGIPYEISGGGTFNESEELGHLLNLLQALAEPEDQVALAAALRGPFYGVSDNLLFRFRHGGGAFSFLVPCERCQDEGVRQQMEPIWRQLQTFHQLTRTEPPAAALAKIMDGLGIVPLALTRELGEGRSGNLLKALELSLGESSSRATSFVDLVERLTLSYKELEIEGMSAEPGKRNAVRIMNLHKAKGLEAPVVFLADPVKDTKHEPSLHISRSKDTALGHFPASRSFGEHGTENLGIPANWLALQEIEKNYQQAEEDRLLYVATTRAKQLLVVSRYPDKADKGAWKSLYPHLTGVPELDIPDRRKIGIPEIEIEPGSFAAAQNEIAERIARSKTNSYEEHTVTSLAEEDREGVPWSEGSDQGMIWGRVVHRILEHLVRESTVDFRTLVESVLEQEGGPSFSMDSVIEAIQAVVSSPLWRRAKESQSTLAEVPFSLRIRESDVPHFITGTIDLVFKEPDGWVIVDYKTDRVNGNLQALTDFYRPQVAMYRKFWAEISRETVKEAGLFFVGTQEWVVI